MLKPYEDENGHPLCISLVDNFVASTPGELDLLSSSSDTDKKTFIRLAHTLKSTAAVLGGVRLAEICADLEHREMSPDERRMLIQKAREGFEELKSILKSYIQETDWKKHG